MSAPEGRGAGSGGAGPAVLVVNAGSSSVKLRVVEADERVRLGDDLGPPGPDLADRLADFLGRAGPVGAAGHRVVHGGPGGRDAVLLDGAGRAHLDTLTDLAPLHNPPALAGIDALARLAPQLPAVACFDTGFHATLPPEAATYALPPAWVARWGIRRYGFHGLSCAWALRRVAELAGPGGAPDRLVVCHLGSGASVTAVRGGRSVDTTMGFTPLEGLVMATRPGDVDPGVLSWLARHGVPPAEVEDALEHRSGLAALAAGSGGDMRAVLARRAGGDPAAALAVATYLHRLRAKVASMAAAAGGIDALVFSGGVGEHSPEIRAEACAGLGWLGVRLDDAANRAVGPDDAEVSEPGSTVRVLVVHAREELVVAAACRRVLAAG